MRQQKSNIYDMLPYTPPCGLRTDYYRIRRVAQLYVKSTRKAVTLEATSREEYWSRFPNTFDVNQEYVAGKGYRDGIIREMQALPALGELVELGCGTGCFTEAIAAKADRVVATDLSDVLLDVARKRLDGQEEVSFQIEDCMATTFPAARFDSVFMANLLHVIENPAGALTESRRIVREGGTLVIATFTSDGMSAWQKLKMGLRFAKTWGKPPAHVHTFTPASLAEMMEEAGFTVESIRKVGVGTNVLFAVGKAVSGNT